MKPFLLQIAERFYAEYGDEVSRLAFVFPNRRAGLFFQKYLSEVSPRPLFSPTILTINDLFVKLSGKQGADHLSLIFLLYEIYKERSGSEESFDDFLYWGEMLLSDFDDVDKYLADARLLFSNIADLRELDDLFDYLSQEQLDAIRSFWSSFYPRRSPSQEQFLALWEILFDVYTAFRERLAQKGLGYEGMIFREVVESLEKDDSLEIPYPLIVFVGLNALSTVEIRFLEELQRRGKADFYWDYASSFVRDPENRASFFALPNLRRFPSRLELPKEDGDSTPEIVTIGVSSGIGQAKEVYYLLKDLCEQKLLDGDLALRTAIVLPDENLLVPVLNAIPEEIKHINVTMGYPLSGTPVASLMDYILALQRNIRFIDRQPMFYFRDVLPVLNHRYVSMAEPEIVPGLVREIGANNRIYIPETDLARSPLLSLLFQPISSLGDFSDYLIEVLSELNRRLSALRDDTGDDDERPQRTVDIEQEFIFHYFTTVNRMKDILREAGITMKLDTYFRLLRRVTEGITIPFRGEPLSGLQIMGVLETRALDFERIIILSMNEGIFPLKRVANSFIPYNLRRGFGLPTYEHQDSVWAYHFYRLLTRSSQVSLLYDTRSNGLQTGEKSRFIQQLRFHYRVPMLERLLVFEVSSAKASPLAVAKDSRVMQMLADFREGGSRALSASALNYYMDCPLKFYYAILVGIGNEEEVTENIENDMFGSILHKTLELVFRPYRGQIITPDLLKLLRRDEPTLTGAIARAFAEVFFKSDVVRTLSGQNYLVGELIRKYVLRVLERDFAIAPFHYIESERLIRTTFPLSGGGRVQLKGFIDRVDDVKGSLRIVDYKSGTGKADFASLDALFDRTLKERPKAVFQVFFYAWMYSRLPEASAREIRPVIYYMRSLFQEKTDTAVYQTISRGKREPVDAFRPLSADFEERLAACLDEIFDPSKPFEQTEIADTCAYCPFASLCGR